MPVLPPTALHLFSAAPNFPNHISLPRERRCLTTSPPHPSCLTPSCLIPSLHPVPSPGGFEDATLHAKGLERTMMRPRKGLIKYALQHGYAVTPVYTFGESDTYYSFTGLLEQRLALNKYSIPGVAFFGWWKCPVFPRLESEILTYVGPPLQQQSVTRTRLDEQSPASPAPSANAVGAPLPAT